ncbi:hypothetical protein CDL15_Pgr001710 [Punica granatum]|uniref:Cytochrome P450 81E8-like n=1 Tax=Punica granatum TaxID=22663 RepID=A0A218XBQ2_PUNGR|nr:hypothetical protein CDL15_Pgr001710 [Punica granatum]
MIISLGSNTSISSGKSNSRGSIDVSSCVCTLEQSRFAGHLHYLKHPLHRALRDLAEKHGPVFFLRFGSQPTVIVSSLEAAEECFTKNDIILANRPRRSAGKYFGYNYTTISASPYGDHWRNLRRVSTIEIFSAHRLNVLAEIRRDEIRRLLHKLSAGSLKGVTWVELKSKLTDLTFNIMMRMVAGKRYFQDEVEDEELMEFKYLIKEVVKLGGAVNLGEFVPVPRWMGFYRKFFKNIIEIFRRTDAFMQGLIDQHRRKKIDGSEIKNTMLDHLLYLQESEPEYYTDEIIKGLIMHKTREEQTAEFEEQGQRAAGDQTSIGTSNELRLGRNFDSSFTTRGANF